MSKFTLRAGRWSAAHRKLAVGGWIAFVVAAVVLGGMAGFVEQDSDHGVGSSGRADAALDAAFPERPHESVIVEDAPAGPVLRALRAADGVTSATVAQRNGGATLIDVRLEDAESAVALLEVTERLGVGQFGEASVEAGMDEAMGEDMAKAETLSIPLTLILLLLAFGSVLAALIPLGLALSAVAAAMGISALLSHVVVMEETVNSVILLVGLAVGVDYALFYLRRARGDGLEVAAATSGHAVLVSGITVMIAMAGMFLAGDAIFTALAIGSIVVVACALLASLTVVPALIGRRTLKGRDRSESRVWAAVLSRVLRRPALSAAASGAVLVALAIPALGMETALPGMSTLSDKVAGKRAFERIEAAFPGGSMPATVVVRGGEGVDAAIAKLDPLSVRRAGDVRAVEVAIPGDGTDDRSRAALRELRAETIPAAFAGTGARVDVTGLTAGTADFTQLMRDRVPLVFAFVLGLAFVLLLVTFRSVVIPVKAIVLNLLSVGAAYGVLALAYSEPIAAWLPMFLFVILFGLSMDYHVFIVTRIRELRMAGRTTRDAVTEGIRSTAGVVTAAAAIMVAVFGAFGTVSSLEMQQMGIGLAAAVLLDATLIRAVLLPSTMALLGEANWWWPRRRAAAPSAGAVRANA